MCFRRKLLIITTITFDFTHCCSEYKCGMGRKDGSGANCGGWMVDSGRQRAEDVGREAEKNYVKTWYRYREVLVRGWSAETNKINRIKS